MYYGRTFRFWWTFGPNGVARAGRWRPPSTLWRMSTRAKRKSESSTSTPTETPRCVTTSAAFPPCCCSRVATWWSSASAQSAKRKCRRCSTRTSVTDRNEILELQPGPCRLGFFYGAATGNRGRNSSPVAVASLVREAGVEAVERVEAQRNKFWVSCLACSSSAGGWERARVSKSRRAVRPQLQVVQLVSLARG